MASRCGDHPAAGAPHCHSPNGRLFGAGGQGHGTDLVIGFIELSRPATSSPTPPSSPSPSMALWHCSTLHLLSAVALFQISERRFGRHRSGTDIIINRGETAAGGHAHPLFETAGEMRLIGKAAGEGHVSGWHAPGQHAPARGYAAGQIGMWGDMIGGTESADQTGAAAARQLSSRSRPISSAKWL